MSKSYRTITLLAILAIAPLNFSYAEIQPLPSMDEQSSAIIERLLSAEKAQEEKLHDVIVDAVLIERRLKGNNEVKEEKRFEKKIFFQRRTDSTRYWNIHEEFLSYHKNNEEQEAKKLKDEVKSKIEKQKKGRGNDKSKPITDIFLPRFREFYIYTYEGLADSLIDGRTCYHLKVRALDVKEDKKSRLNAEFYIDTASARVVYVEFSPAKMAGGLMFKFKEMNMKLWFTEVSDGIWLPKQFWMRGKAKAGIFFTVRFEATETYSNPQTNTGIDTELFADPMSYIQIGD